jgi:hypothetical protein
MNDKQRSICRRILAHYGVNNQHKQAIQECSELITAICHRMDGRATDDAVIDELEDVSIMVEQRVNVYGRARVESRIEDKLRRQLERIKEVEDGRILSGKGSSSAARVPGGQRGLQNRRAAAGGDPVGLLLFGAESREDRRQAGR